MTRSNRTLTQFAVNTLQEYLDREAFYDVRSEGNTAVYAAPRGGEVLYGIELFGKGIFRLIVDSSSFTATGICLYTGDFYDSKGRPSRTTRERLNGLLDALGEAGVIPEGVRAFIDPETGQSRVGKGDDYRVFGSTNDTLGLLPNTNRLEFSR